MNFNTGFYSKGELVLERRKIAGNYLRWWFWLDLLSSFPYNWCTEGFDQTNSSSHSATYLFLTKICRFLRIFRLIRLVKMKHLVVKLEDYLASTTVTNAFVFLKLLCLVFFIAHWIACWFYYISSLDTFNGPQTWISDLTGDEGEVDNAELYVTALYFAFTTMTTTGYGDVISYTTLERVNATCTMIISCGFFAYVIGAIGSVVGKQNAEANAYRERVLILNRFMMRNDIPRDLQYRVRRFLEYIWEDQKHMRIKEEQILSMVSEPLKNEIYAQVHGAIVLRCPVFKAFDMKLIAQLSQSFSSETFAPGDVLFREGQLGSKMYYMKEGKIDIFHQGTSSSFTILGRKCYFGEIAFFANQPRCASVRCLEFAETLVLDRVKFNNLLSQYPKARTFTNELMSRVSNGDLSPLHIHCYICKEKGHIARSCFKAVLNADREALGSRWLRTRATRTRYISDITPGYPNYERVPKKPLRIRYSARNAFGGKRKTMSLEQHNSKLYPLAQHYIRTVDRLKNHGDESTSDSVQFVNIPEQRQKVLQPRVPTNSILIEESSDDEEKEIPILIRSRTFRKSLLASFHSDQEKSLNDVSVALETRPGILLSGPFTETDDLIQAMSSNRRRVQSPNNVEN